MLPYRYRKLTSVHIVFPHLPSMQIALDRCFVETMWVFGGSMSSRYHLHYIWFHLNVDDCWKSSKHMYSISNEQPNKIAWSKTAKKKKSKKNKKCLTLAHDEMELNWQYFHLMNRGPHKIRRNFDCSNGLIRSRKSLQVWNVLLDFVGVPIDNTEIFNS